jgi:hypothetical protein
VGIRGKLPPITQRLHPPLKGVGHMNHYTPDGRDLRAELAPYLHRDENLI